MKVFNFLAACATMLVVTTSCEHKELCYNHPHNGRVNVVFDWTYAPNANPASMYVFFYPADGGSPYQYELNGRNGGAIEILEGDYTAVCINADTSKLRYSLPTSGTYSTALYNLFEVYTDASSVLDNVEDMSKALRSSAPRPAGTEDEAVATTPEAFYTDTQADVTVLSVKVIDSQTIIMYPRQGHCNYQVIINQIDNVDNVRSLSAIITGMSGGLNVAQRMPTDEVVTFPFSVAFDETSATGNSEFYTFGHCPGEQHSHYIMVYAVMKDGYSYYYSVDVTDQVHNAKDPYNVVITIDNLPLPDVISAGGSGLAPVVEEWDSVTITVPMKTYE